MPKVAAELGEPGTRFFLAHDGEGDAGYAYLRATRGAAPPGVVGRLPFEIVRFYVDQAWHGRGVAQELMARCLSDARAAGGDVVWLQVWQRAPRPQAFYRRAGFAVVGVTTFTFGDRIDDDFVMARALVP